MVYVLLAPGFEEAEALVPVDLLRRAGIPAALVGLTGPEVTGAHHITVRADQLLSEIDPETAEMVILPGGTNGVAAISSSPPALSFIQTLYNQGSIIAAICAAPTILASLGLLHDRSVICYPGMEDRLAGATVEKGVSVVEDGPIITGEAAGSAFAFGLKLVKALRGHEAAEQIKNEIYYHGQTY